MASTVSNALLLLVIGMITVFVILLLVTLCGKTLIALVNKYGAEPKSAIPASLPLVNNTSNRHQPAVLAVIAAAVDHTTDGQGHVTSITKINR